MRTFLASLFVLFVLISSAHALTPNPNNVNGSCSKATTSAFGCVKPDGSTITISNGVISSTGGSGSGTVSSSTIGQIPVYTGATTVTGNTAFLYSGGVVTIGTTTATATGKINLTGGTSGVITIQPQAAAGTYNWNLPTTAGSSGNILTSGGGSGTAMTWDTTTGSGNVVVLATSPALTTPDLGTPSAATLTNATGLPVSSGISGLGTGVATFLATPSSANLAAAITDETGTGVAVFGTAPTFTTSITDPLIIGGTGTTSTLSLRPTSGSGTTGADIIFQSGTNGATETMRILNAGTIGIGTSVAASTITLDGQATKTIAMNRNYTAATAGVAMTVQAGGAVSGGTNLAGGTLNLSAGQSTGLGTSAVNLNIYGPTSTGTSDSSVTSVVISGIPALTGSAWINLPTNASGIGDGGPGVNAWIARSNSANQWFTGSAAGDIAYRSASGNKLIWGTAASATSVMSMTSAAFTVTQAIINTGITTDATHTTSTVCQDTTTHQFYFGSGTVGICLGTSSKRYKHDINPLVEGMSELEHLKPVTFFYNKGRGDNGVKRQNGFLAEDMVSVFPTLVDLDKEGKPNSVDLVGLIPVLVHAVQQQQQQIDDLKRQLGKR